MEMNDVMRPGHFFCQQCGNILDTEGRCHHSLVNESRNLPIQIVEFPKFTIEWQRNLQEFIRFWSKFYNYPDEHLYSERITKVQFSISDIEALYLWKNNGRLSQKKEEALHKKIIARLELINELKENFQLEKFLNEFKNVSAIWKIFLLHTIAPYQYPIFDQHVYRIVSSNLDVSFGILHVPLDIFKCKTTKRINSRLKHAYGQLQKEHDFKYYVVVLDIRNEGINEYMAYQEVMRLLLMQKYQNLSGVILFTHRIDPNRTFAPSNVILIPNQQSRNTLDDSLFFKSDYIPQIVYQRLSLWFLLSKIPIQKGWNEWFKIEPRFQITYNDYTFGNLF